MATTKTIRGSKTKMPERFPDDPMSVKMLLDECERLNQLAKKWEQAKDSNPISINQTYGMAHLMETAGAWLRCKLSGELLPEKTKLSKLRGVLQYTLDAIQPVAKTGRCAEAGNPIGCQNHLIATEELLRDTLAKL